LFNLQFDVPEYNKDMFLYIPVQQEHVCVYRPYNISRVQQEHVSCISTIITMSVEITAEEVKEENVIICKPRKKKKTT